MFATAGDFPSWLAYQYDLKLQVLASLLWALYWTDVWNARILLLGLAVIVAVLRIGFGG
jgi:hypothetical protein